MTPVKIIGILGFGGLRMDFVAGWLGKLPNFVESNWNIDPVTRQSVGTTFNNVDLSDPVSLNGFLESHRYVLDSTAKLIFATKLHAFALEYQPMIDNKSIEIYELCYDSNNLDQVYWEFVIKTFGKLSANRSWNVDNFINKDNIIDQDRAEWLDLKLRKKHKVQKDKQSNFSGLEYSRLFCNDGSRYLCDALEITADTAYHAFWNIMLPLAVTPDEIELWGKTWRRQDYF
jgi:hypothetical protein